MDDIIRRVLTIEAQVIMLLGAEQVEEEAIWQPRAFYISVDTDDDDNEPHASEGSRE